MATSGLRRHMHTGARVHAQNEEMDPCALFTLIPRILSCLEMDCQGVFYSLVSDGARVRAHTCAQV